MGRIKRLGLTALVAALMVAAAMPIAEGGSTIRTRGTGWHVGISWMEVDRDDLLGLPGNVHVGSMWGFDDQYGRFIFGHIVDWECPDGELPGHGFGAGVVAAATRAADRATDDTVDAIVDSGAATIDAAAVTAARRAATAAATVEDFEEPPSPCDFVQAREIDGTNARVTVDQTKGKLTMTGSLTVTGGHGGPVLGRPPVNITITGGSWEKSDYANKYWGEGYRYEEYRSGTSWHGGKVSGSIGAMGFDDDPDDTSFAGFGGFSFRTLDRIR